MSKVKFCSLCLGILLVLPSLALAAAGTKPTITGILPNNATAGSAALVLTVTGSNFSSGVVVLWNGSALATTRVGFNQLKATIPATALASAGSAVVTVYVPGRNGGASNGVTFAIAAAASGGSSTTPTAAPTPLAVSTTSIPAGTTGTAYSAALAATGGTAPYAWSVTSGALPTGLTLSSAGAISGTPTTSGSASFVAQVKDSASNVQSYTYSASIAAGTTTPLSVSTASLPGGTAGTAYTSTSLAATGGTSPYTWSVASGSTLPAGLTLSTAGALSGTPTTANTYSFSLQVTDSASNTATKAYSVTVAAATTSTSTASLSSYCYNGTYGTCGDPYEGVAFTTTGKTAVSSCPTGDLVAHTSYYLTGNIGFTPSAVCINIEHDVTLDLRGYSVTGRIVTPSANGFSNGTVIFNGLVQCSSPDTNGVGCVNLYNAIPMTELARVHHLVVDNAADPGAGGVRTIALESDGSAPGVGGYRVDHVTLTVESAPTSVRSVGINMNVIDSMDVDSSWLTCSTNASACQGIQVVNGYHGPVTGNYYNNYLVMNSAVPGATGRGIIVQGNDTDTVGPTGFQVYGNTCIANNNRCFRARQVSGATFYNNTVLNCAETSGAEGCYHFGDPDQPTATTAVSNLGVVVQNESIQVVGGGKAFFIRNAGGVSIKNLSITGDGTGQLGYAWTYQSQIPASVTLCAITGASSLASNSLVNTDGSSPAAANVYQGGSWGGTGTVNTLSSCPF